MAKSGQFVIDLSVMKTECENFQNCSSSYGNDTYSYFKNSYLTKCSDSTIKRAVVKISRYYDNVQKDYNAIYNWWKSYLANVNGLENYLSGQGISTLSEQSLISFLKHSLEKLSSYEFDTTSNITDKYSNKIQNNNNSLSFNNIMLQGTKTSSNVKYNNQPNFDADNDIDNISYNKANQKNQKLSSNQNANLKDTNSKNVQKGSTLSANTNNNFNNLNYKNQNTNNLSNDYNTNTIGDINSKNQSKDFSLNDEIVNFEDIFVTNDSTNNSMSNINLGNLVNSILTNSHIGTFVNSIDNMNQKSLAGNDKYTIQKSSLGLGGVLLGIGLGMMGGSSKSGGSTNSSSEATSYTNNHYNSSASEENSNNEDYVFAKNSYASKDSYINTMNIQNIDITRKFASFDNMCKWTRKIVMLIKSMLTNSSVFYTPNGVQYETKTVDVNSTMAAYDNASSVQNLNDIEAIKTNAKVSKNRYADLSHDQIKERLSSRKDTIKPMEKVNTIEQNVAMFGESVKETVGGYAEYAKNLFNGLNVTISKISNKSNLDKNEHLEFKESFAWANATNEVNDEYKNELEKMNDTIDYYYDTYSDLITLSEIIQSNSIEKLSDEQKEELLQAISKMVISLNLNNNLTENEKELKEILPRLLLILQNNEYKDEYLDDIKTLLVSDLLQEKTMISQLIYSMEIERDKLAYSYMPQMSDFSEISDFSNLYSNCKVDENGNVIESAKIYFHDDYININGIDYKRTLDYNKCTFDDKENVIVADGNYYSMVDKLTLSWLNLNGKVEFIDENINDLPPEYAAKNVKLMTEEEIQTYHYIFEKYGETKAQDYFNTLEDTLNQRKGFEEAMEYFRSVQWDDYVEQMAKMHLTGIGDGMISWAENVNNAIFADGVLSAESYKQMWMLQILNGNVDTESLNAEDKNLVEQLKEQYAFTGKSLGYSYQIGNTIGNMLPSVIISATLSPLFGAYATEIEGVETATKLANAGTKLSRADKLELFIEQTPQLIGTGLIGVSTYGATKDQALHDGSTEFNANVQALLSAVSEAGLEYFLGRLPFLNKNVETTKNLKSVIKNAVLDLAQEGGEECIQEFCGMCISMANGEHISFEQFTETEIQTFAMSAIVSAEMNGANVAISFTGNTITFTADEIKRIYNEKGIAGVESTVKSRIENTAKTNVNYNNNIIDNNVTEISNNVNEVIDNNVTEISNNVNEVIDNNVTEISNNVNESITSTEETNINNVNNSKNQNHKFDFLKQFGQQIASFNELLAGFGFMSIGCANPLLLPAGLVIVSDGAFRINKNVKNIVDNSKYSLFKATKKGTIVMLPDSLKTISDSMKMVKEHGANNTFLLQLANTFTNLSRVDENGNIKEYNGISHAGTIRQLRTMQNLGFIQNFTTTAAKESMLLSEKILLGNFKGAINSIKNHKKQKMYNFTFELTDKKFTKQDAYDLVTKTTKEQVEIKTNKKGDSYLAFKEQKVNENVEILEEVDTGKVSNETDVIKIKPSNVEENTLLKKVMDELVEKFHLTYLTVNTKAISQKVSPVLTKLAPLGIAIGAINLPSIFAGATIIGEIGGLAARFYEKSVSTNIDLYNKCKNEGIYHFTSVDAAKKIVESGNIRPTQEPLFLKWMYDNDKAYAFPGLPDFDTLTNNKLGKLDTVIAAVNVKLTDEQLNQLNYRVLDNAVTYKGGLQFNQEQAEIVYFGLAYENGEYVYKQIQENEVEGYSENFNKFLKENNIKKFNNIFKNFYDALKAEVKHDLNLVVQLTNDFKTAYFNKKLQSIATNDDVEILEEVDVKNNYNVDSHKSDPSIEYLEDMSEIESNNTTIDEDKNSNINMQASTTTSIAYNNMTVEEINTKLKKINENFEHNPNAVSFIDDFYMNLAKNGTYGTDQGILRLIMQSENLDSAKRNRNIRVRNLENLIKLQLPNIHKKTLLNYLSKIDTNELSGGVCSYAPIVNSIINYFSDKPELFREKFGFDLWSKSIDSKTGMECVKIAQELILADIYTFVNKTNFNRYGIDPNLFFKNGNWHYEDHGHGRGSAVYQVFAAYSWLCDEGKSLNCVPIMAYLKSKGLNLSAKQHKLYESSYKRGNVNLDDIKNKIELALNNKKTIYIGVNKGDTGGIYIYNKPNPTTDDDNVFIWTGKEEFAENKLSGHAMTVTGITDNGMLIVDTWGYRKYISLEEFVQNNSGVISVIDISEHIENQPLHDFYIQNNVCASEHYLIDGILAIDPNCSLQTLNEALSISRNGLDDRIIIDFYKSHRRLFNQEEQEYLNKIVKYSSNFLYQSKIMNYMNNKNILFSDKQLALIFKVFETSNFQLETYLLDDENIFKLDDISYEILSELQGEYATVNKILGLFKNSNVSKETVLSLVKLCNQDIDLSNAYFNCLDNNININQMLSEIDMLMKLKSDGLVSYEGLKYLANKYNGYTNGKSLNELINILIKFDNKLSFKNTKAYEILFDKITKIDLDSISQEDFVKLYDIIDKKINANKNYEPLIFTYLYRNDISNSTIKTMINYFENIMIIPENFDQSMSESLIKLYSSVTTWSFSEMITFINNFYNIQSDKSHEILKYVFIKYVKLDQNFETSKQLNEVIIENITNQFVDLIENKFSQYELSDFTKDNLMDKFTYTNDYTPDMFYKWCEDFGIKKKDQNIQASLNLDRDNNSSNLTENVEYLEDITEVDNSNDLVEETIDSKKKLQNEINRLNELEQIKNSNDYVYDESIEKEYFKLKNIVEVNTIDEETYLDNEINKLLELQKNNPDDMELTYKIDKLKITKEKILSYKSELTENGKKNIKDLAKTGKKSNKLAIEFKKHVDMRVTEILNQAKLLEHQVTEELKLLESASAALIGEDRKLKSRDSLERKVTTESIKLAKERGHELTIDDIDEISSEICDSLRYTLLIEPTEYKNKVQSSLDELTSKGYEIVNYKNYWYMPHYKGINVQIKTPTDFVFELQFHTLDSFKTKETLTHEFYEIKRNMLLPETTQELANYIQNAYQSLVETPEGIDGYNWYIEHQFEELGLTLPMISISKLCRIIEDKDVQIKLKNFENHLDYFGTEFTKKDYLNNMLYLKKLHNDGKIKLFSSFIEKLDKIINEYIK